jgi:hypothetical protein
MTTIIEIVAVEQILLWYDQPEIVLLKRDNFEYILAVSSAVEEAGECKFVGASMTLQQVAGYQNGKFDLRYAMSHANLRRYWEFEFRGHELQVAIKKIRKTSDEVNASIPDAGFFSREHHFIEAIKRQAADSDEQFDIDGSWELGEFSRFYGQVEDIYYMFSDLSQFNDPNTPTNTKTIIANAFDRPWRGGGSYVGFYDKIANDNQYVAPLRVSGIQYNSPGFVKIRAKKEPFENIIALLQGYAHEIRETRRAHNALYKLMSFSKLLKPDRRAVPSKAIRESVLDLAKNLASHMPGVDLSLLVDMARGDEIVAAKVLLSIFRRMERLYKFFEEGRVKYKGLETDAMVDSDA